MVAPSRFSIFFSIVLFHLASCALILGKYVVDEEVIGSGAYGEVRMVSKKTSGNDRLVIKTVILNEDEPTDD